MEGIDQFHDLALVLLRFVLVSLCLIGGLALRDGGVIKRFVEHNSMETV